MTSTPPAPHSSDAFGFDDGFGETQFPSSASSGAASLPLKTESDPFGDAFSDFDQGATQAAADNSGSDAWALDDSKAKPPSDDAFSW